MDRLRLRTAPDTTLPRLGLGSPHYHERRVGSRHSCSLIGNAGRPPRPGPQGMRVRSDAGGQVSGEDVVRVAVQVLASWDRAPGKSVLRAGQAGDQKAADRRRFAGEECRLGGSR
jgi:hypothetical protein